MERSEIGMLRLGNQRISANKAKNLKEISAWMGAMQGQDLAAVKRAAAVRTEGGLTEAYIDKALTSGEIVRAWSLRGTIQMVPANDAGWMAELMSARIAASASRVELSLGLDDAVIAKAGKIFTAALKGGKVLERQELYERLEAKGIATEGQRGYHLLFRAGLKGLICFGPRSDRQPTFVLMQDWVQQPTRLTRPASLAELARRYFRSHGPATIQDFSWWTGLSLTESRQGLDAIREEVIEEPSEGELYWLYATSGAIEPGFYLLPGFDEFILGYKDRSAVINPKLARALSPYKNGIFLPVMVSGGRVVGTWSRKQNKASVDVEGKPFASLSAKEERGFKAEAEVYVSYLGVRLGKVSLAK